MLAQFQNFIAANNLFDVRQRLLVAVSGGVDSMTLLHLLQQGGYIISVAHCNFGLRGLEADGDEELVRTACKYRGIPIFIKHFDTAAYASASGISLEMAARELRYAWFGELAREHGFEKIVVAHNANDAAETFLLNLARGTGLRGLSGISAAQPSGIVRPLLWAERAQIEQYAADNRLQYREDSTNNDLRYLRNRVRHNIIPECQQLNPSFLQTMQRNMEHIGQVEQVMADLVQALRRKACTNDNGVLKMKISELPTSNRRLWLFYLLYDFKFSAAAIADMANALDGASGKRFYAPAHVAVKDREHLIVLPKSGEPEATEVNVAADVCTITLGDKTFTFDIMANARLTLNQGAHVAMLDFGKLRFPLTLRRWQAGDAFVPLGMCGKKKLSDFYTDAKLSLADKQRQLVVCSADGRIVWLVGHRIDERCKVLPETEAVLRIACCENT